MARNVLPYRQQKLDKVLYTGTNFLQKCSKTLLSSWVLCFQRKRSKNVHVLLVVQEKCLLYDTWTVTLTGRYGDRKRQLGVLLLQGVTQIWDNSVQKISRQIITILWKLWNAQVWKINSFVCRGMKPQLIRRVVRTQTEITVPHHLPGELTGWSPQPRALRSGDYLWIEEIAPESTKATFWEDSDSINS